MARITCRQKPLAVGNLFSNLGGDGNLCDISNITSPVMRNKYKCHTTLALDQLLQNQLALLRSIQRTIT
jgi:hypothetical protein